MAAIDRMNIPEALMGRLLAAYGDEADRVIAGYCVRRAVTFRVNTCKTTTQAVRDTLTDQGISLRPVPWYSDAFLVENVREHVLEQLPMYERGEIYLQSLSSMLPPIVLAPEAGENILDMTAAPGGKTTQLYALSHGKALITACERDPIRFDRMKFNLLRQGATRVNAMKTDALALDDFLKFDKILLDAPCTGTGTHDASAPVRFADRDLARCTRWQQKLLAKALKLLKKGGTLLYSTCSVLPDENDRIVEGALKSGAKLLPVSLPGIPTLPSLEGTVCVCPSEQYEGFYLAKLTI